MGRIKIALRANFGPLVCSFRLPALRSHKDSVLLKWCATLENMKFCKCIVALQSRWKKSESHREESSTCKELNRFRENLLSINYCDTRAKQSVMCPSVMTDQPLHPPTPHLPSRYLNALPEETACDDCQTENSCLREAPVSAKCDCVAANHCWVIRFIFSSAFHKTNTH